MPTKYAALTSEQRESYNASRREQYKALPTDIKQTIQSRTRQRQAQLSVEQRETQRVAQRIPTSLKRISLEHFDGTMSTVTDPKMQKWLIRIARKRKTHNTAWDIKRSQIQDWQTLTGAFPWPNLDNKLALTRLWTQIFSAVGPVCMECGTKEVFPTQWRLTLKSDVMAFVQSRKSNYAEVLRNPQNFLLLCSSCAFDLRLLAFAWVFSPHSPRNCLDVQPAGFSGTKHARWDTLWPGMYPPGLPLQRRIQSGAVRSLSYRLRLPDGGEQDSILRANPYYSWVADNPMAIVWPEIERYNENSEGTGSTSGV